MTATARKISGYCEAPKRERMRRRWSVFLRPFVMLAHPLKMALAGHLTATETFKQHPTMCELLSCLKGLDRRTLKAYNEDRPTPLHWHY